MNVAVPLVYLFILLSVVHASVETLDDKNSQKDNINGTLRADYLVKEPSTTVSILYDDDTNSSDMIGVQWDSCIAQPSCENCTSLHGCHWCSYDQTCHAIGSIHGCAFGSSCGAPPPVPDKNGTDDNDKTCYSKLTCRDCALYSHLCHWCAFDNACHVIGSVHGCVTGVNCYDNDRCQRKDPEPLPPHPAFNIKHITTGMGGILPLIAILSISGVIICCATICCCISRGVKGAYDDLAELSQRTSVDGSNNLDENNNNDLSAPLLTSASLSSTPRSQEQQVIAFEETVPESSETAQLLSETEEGNVGNSNEAQAPVAASEETQQQAENNTQSIATSPETTIVNNTRPTIINNSRVYFYGSRRGDRHSTRRGRRSGSMQCLYNACVCVYVTTILIVVLFTVAVVRYFPQRPVYNVCNNDVAWKSLIDSMTSMKVTADFEILISISNPNYFDVELDMGTGSFAHAHTFVGTFDIPAVTVAANSITDTLIIAHFSPDKWEALSITSEYYHGKLVLMVDMSARIRIPALLDYSFQLKLNDLLVNVNALSDRSLCACPTWDDPNPPQSYKHPEFMLLELQ